MRERNELDDFVIGPQIDEFLVDPEQSDWDDDLNTGHPTGMSFSTSYNHIW